MYFGQKWKNFNSQKLISQNETPRVIFKLKLFDTLNFTLALTHEDENIL